MGGRVKHQLSDQCGVAATAGNARTTAPVSLCKEDNRGQLSAVEAALRLNPFNWYLSKNRSTALTI